MLLPMRVLRSMRSCMLTPTLSTPFLCTSLLRSSSFLPMLLFSFHLLLPYAPPPSLCSLFFSLCSSFSLPMLLLSLPTLLPLLPMLLPLLPYAPLLLPPSPPYALPRSSLCSLFFFLCSLFSSLCSSFYFPMLLPLLPYAPPSPSLCSSSFLHMLLLPSPYAPSSPSLCSSLSLPMLHLLPPYAPPHLRAPRPTSLLSSSSFKKEVSPPTCGEVGMKEGGFADEAMRKEGEKTRAFDAPCCAALSELDEHENGP